ncbi:hypothetical protein Mgra_00005482, partial [Meloidogyne graminicola]
MPILQLINRFSFKKNKKVEQQIINNSKKIKINNEKNNKNINEIKENLKEDNLIKKEEINKENINLKLFSSNLEQNFVKTFCLTIHLHEGLDLQIYDTCLGSSDPYIKCQYKGKTIYKSEIIFKELNPKWDEEFSFLIENIEEIITFKVFDFDRYLIISITLTPLNEKEKEMFIKKSIKGIISERKIINKRNDQQQKNEFNENNCSNFVQKINEINGINYYELINKYNFWSSFNSLKDVGVLIFKVFEAEGLSSLDVNGKSDPFCLLELCNLFVQTHTEYKTLNPKWNSYFIFPIKDINQIIELTIFDEDPNKRIEFIGKIAIPLLEIFNGEKRWYLLKNKKLDGLTKGKVLIEGNLYFNYFKAIIQTFKPKEIKLKQPLERFKRQKFLSNANRLYSIIDLIVNLNGFNLLIIFYILFI